VTYTSQILVVASTSAGASPTVGKAQANLLILGAATFQSHLWLLLVRCNVPIALASKESIGEGWGVEAFSFELGSDPSCTCVICLEDLSNKCTACRLACGHTFHHKCISGWAQSCGSKTFSCPLRCESRRTLARDMI
jgi:hypothetical protein